MSLSTCEHCGGHIPLGPTASNRCEKCGRGVFESMDGTITCAWTAEGEDGIWSTVCGNAFLFEAYGPHENGFKFCPYCGKPIEAVHAPD